MKTNPTLSPRQLANTYEILVDHVMAPSLENPRLIGSALNSLDDLLTVLMKLGFATIPPASRRGSNPSSRSPMGISTRDLRRMLEVELPSNPSTPSKAAAPTQSAE